MSGSIREVSEEKEGKQEAEPAAPIMFLVTHTVDMRSLVEEFR
jgi:hypothetical protein